MTGFHAPRILAVLTEAQGVEDFAWEGLLACATGPEDRVLAVGNPLAPSGRFYAVSRSRSWEAIRISAFEHPNLRNGATPIPGGPSRAFIERIASEFGKDSGIYQSRVEGEFPDQGEEGLFRRSWLEAAADRHGEVAGHAEADTLTVAVDPARYGPDETVLAVRRGAVLLELINWSRADLMETVNRIRAVLDQLGVEPGIDIARSAVWGSSSGSSRGSRARGLVVVDEVGLGTGVLDRLRELKYRARGFNGGKMPRAKKRFLNVRAESYWHLRELLEAGEIALPRDDKLFDELLAICWRPTPDGKIRIEAKEELKARLGRSPDRADAVSMAFGHETQYVAVTWGT